MKTTKIILLLSLVAMLNASCAVTAPQIIKKEVPPKAEVGTIINASIDEVWDTIIDFFAENNIPIKTIDRASFLIVSESVTFPCTYWIEGEGDVKPNAYVRVQYAQDFKRDGTGLRCSGGWNVRLKKINDKQTKAFFNLAGVKAYCSFAKYDYYKGWITEEKATDLITESTGNMEKMIKTRIEELRK